MATTEKKKVDRSKKRLRVIEERRVANLAVKRSLRHACRKVRNACAEGDIQTAEDGFRLASKHLDQAASKRVTHPNQASRVKSRLSACIKKAKNPA